ncbi:hypothetical protein [Shewanella surugensis]|uniref:Uncharacterized protein n=1 Tax=Shewanella surugensis TaxID=212020 RepID=A0ABT0LC96_9GAMM|nr:hypothetical protein [Shewanella surugensis]MCL1125293.1 hypothetical protein [Shewanella surugensis]
MKTFFCSILMGLLFGLNFSAQADPIQDLSMNAYKAGWFPNFYQGQAMTCPKACEVWVGTRAEQEKTTDIVSTKDVAYVCKITRDPAIIMDPQNDPSSHWIYGSQFDDVAACFATRNIGSDLFMCLCVDY